MLRRNKTAALASGLIVVLAVVFLIFWGLSSSSKTNTIAQEALEINQSVRKAFSSRADYRGLDSLNAIKQGIVSPTLVRSDKIYSRLQSEIVIGRDEDGAILRPGDYYFKVTYKNLDRRKCLALLGGDFGIDSGLTSVEVKNDAYVVFTYGGENTLPINTEAASKACKTKNIISLTFE